MLQGRDRIPVADKEARYLSVNVIKVQVLLLKRSELDGVETRSRKHLDKVWRRTKAAG